MSETQVKKMRDSNMELLRIVAMLLVLVYHADLLSLGTPDGNELKANMLIGGGKLLVNSCSVVCVDLFVLLSGWFGIKPKIVRVFDFVFQVSFFVVLSWAVNILFFGHNFCFDDVKNLFWLNDNLWFPKAYLLLYILSPVLNAFVEKTDRKTFLCIVIAFFTFQTLYGWLCGGVGWFAGGYSTMSFIGLYLLARYLSVYRPFGNIKSSILMIGYFSVALITTIVWMLLINRGVTADRWLNSYVSPFCIVEAVCLLLFFSRLSFKSKAVNWIAASCFAVYLANCAPNMLHQYVQAISSWYDSYTILPFLCITALFILAFFLSAIMVDKVRMYIWKKCSSKISCS